MNSYIIILLTILQHNYNINDQYKVFWVHKNKNLYFLTQFDIIGWDMTRPRHHGI